MSVRYQRTFLIASLLFAACVVAPPARATSGSGQQQGVTADQQSNAKSDRAITRKIRQALVADKSLSTEAHNVTIVTRNGAVTLRGTVKSEDEKQKVLSTAAQVVDASKIDNQLMVKGA
jgi:hyperosmotically inducible periplasmic protein